MSSHHAIRGSAHRLPVRALHPRTTACCAVRRRRDDGVSHHHHHVVVCGALARDAPADASRAETTERRTATTTTSSPSSLTSSSPSARSRHPDAIRRRLLAERRKHERHAASKALSRRAWWEVASKAPNAMLVMDSDEYYAAMRAARKSGRDVCVHFFSPSCEACRSLESRSLHVARKNPNVLFLKVHHDKCLTLAERHGVTKLPWIQYFTPGAAAPVVEDFRLDAFRELLHVPLIGADAHAADARYCAMQAGAVSEFVAADDPIGFFG